MVKAPLFFVRDSLRFASPILGPNHKHKASIPEPGHRRLGKNQSLVFVGPGHPGKTPVPSITVVSEHAARLPDAVHVIRRHVTADRDHQCAVRQLGGPAARPGPRTQHGGILHFRPARPGSAAIRAVSQVYRSVNPVVLVSLILSAIGQPAYKTPEFWKWLTASVLAATQILAKALGADHHDPAIVHQPHGNVGCHQVRRRDHGRECSVPISPAVGGFNENNLGGLVPRHRTHGSQEGSILLPDDTGSRSSIPVIIDELWTGRPPG